MKAHISKEFLINKQTEVKKKSNWVYTSDHFFEMSSKLSPAENSFTQNVNDCENLIENRSKKLIKL